MDAVLRLTYYIIGKSNRLKNFIEDNYSLNFIILLVVKVYFKCIKAEQAEKMDQIKLRNVVNNLNDRIEEWIRFRKNCKLHCRNTEDMGQMLTVRIFSFYLLVMILNDLNNSFRCC